MNKEKMMEFLSEAIDGGAKISVLILGSNIKRSDAEVKANKFSEIIDGKVVDEKGETYGSTWFAVRGEKFQLDHFYRESESLQEDVDLSGMSDEVNESA